MYRVSKPTEFPTISCASYVPGALYTTVGKAALDEDGAPPGKLQLYDVIVPVDVLVYITLSGAQPEEIEVTKPATGAEVRDTVAMWTSGPHAFAAERVTW
jgi:hypothetical protein